MNLKYLVLITLFLTACQTSDFGLVTREDQKDKVVKDQSPQPEDEDGKSLDQKKVNKNKLFNTTDNQENVRPKIGLILGPGLAYSMAHLGVLKAINDQKIPIHVVGGMGWSSLIAANFALNGAVNDMRWKAFQGSFSNAVSTGFLGGSIKETSDAVYTSLISEYTRGQSLSQSKISFLCPALQITRGRSMIFKSGSYAQALGACMKVPPLAQTEANAWAYILETQDLVQQMKSQGVQKIVYINVIPSTGMNWGKDASSIDGRDKLFWAQVINGLNPKSLGVDHILNLSTEGQLALDFKNTRRMIEDSEKKAQDYFSRFARTYSF
jgi:hypothetical protein